MTETRALILEFADIEPEPFREPFAGCPERVDAPVACQLADAGISRFVKCAWIDRELLHEAHPESERLALSDRFSAIAPDKVLTCPFVPGARDGVAALSGRISVFVASGSPQATGVRFVGLTEVRA